MIVNQKELSLPVSQALALFNKLIRKISKRLADIRKEAIGADIPVAPPSKNTDSRVQGDIEGDGGGNGEASKSWQPIETNVVDELDEAGDEVTRALREKQRAMIEALDLSKYAINDTAADWSTAEVQVSKLAQGNARASVVSVKGGAGGQKRKLETERGAGEKKPTRRGKKVKR